MTSGRPRAYTPHIMKALQHTGAFVIQFQPETAVETGSFEGRVEHIASSMAMHFRSLEEFLSFVTRVLTQVRAEQHERA
jgi:hypothetical protein